MASRIPGTNERSRLQQGSAGDPEASNAAAASLRAANEASLPDTAPTQLDNLEQEKLKAEIDEIRLRIKDQSSGESQRWAKAAIKYIAIIVPLGVGLVGLLIQWNEYQDQRERLARFEVGSEVTQLATQLNDRSDEGQASLAAYQLAWFGRPAVFLLFEQLVTEDRLAVRTAIIMALADIGRSDKGPPSVVALLVESTDAFMSLALDSEEPAVTKIEQRLTALADAAAALRSDKDDGASNKEYLEDLSTARKRIESQPSQRLSDDDKKRLLDIVDRSLQKVSD